MSESSRSPSGQQEFTTLYEREYGDVLRFIQRRAGPDRAEDAAAETFLVAWRRLEEIPAGHDASRAWLFGIARHVLLNQRRGDQRQRALGVRLADEASVRGAAVDAEDLTLVVDLQRVWPRLSAVHQEALSLAVLDDLDAPTAARILEISPVAYRLRLSRARRALRLHLRLPPASSPGPLATVERTVIR
ncbi:RNA polymerase sigma factor [Pimelobacter simplex]|uniref:RNA polymerase sigma factor n=1 Tax=Nocardioides simplex TaxID=2045 RepID=UPI0019311D32|nr:RNA polymerase subunit sigma-70 [Pimelobacter simplex]